MENFTRIDHEDGSIEYINNSIIGSVTITQPIPEDIASLTPEQLQVKILESHKNFVRQERDRRLAECDWTQVADVPLTEEEKNEWRTYRQILRDLPSTIVGVSFVNWPLKP
jgi:hypothetical protein